MCLGWWNLWLQRTCPETVWISSIVKSYLSFENFLASSCILRTSDSETLAKCEFTLVILSLFKSCIFHLVGSESHCLKLRLLSVYICILNQWNKWYYIWEGFEEKYHFLKGSKKNWIIFRATVAALLSIFQQFKKMIANRLNVRPVKVKLPPGANHAYVTFRYSATLFLLSNLLKKKKNWLQYTLQ